MRDLFDRLASEGEAALNELRVNQTAEAVDLDFKEKSEIARDGFNKTDKQILGRTLSAFANSAGGLLIFGAEARKNSDGIDCLNALKPIPNIDRFASEAQTLTGQYLFPRHDGVRQATIYSERRDGSGYLALHVERSNRRPHQSKAPEDGRYYKRAGDSTFVMEHYDVEDAFRRVAAPEIELDLKVLPARYGSGQTWTIPISLGMTNVGASLVRYPYMSILTTNADVIEHHAHLGPRWRLSRDPPGVQFTGGADDVIHVDTTQVGGHLYVAPSMDRGEFMIRGRPYEDFTVFARIQFGAESSRSETREYTFDGDTLYEAMRRGGALT